MFASDCSGISTSMNKQFFLMLLPKKIYNILVSSDRAGSIMCCSTAMIMLIRDIAVASPQFWTKSQAPPLPGFRRLPI